MVCIITRKDQTSIACREHSVISKIRNLRYIEFTIAVVLIVVGTSILLFIQ